MMLPSLSRTAPALLLALAASPALAQNGEGGHTTAAPRVAAATVAAPVVLDGRLEEEVWRSAAPATDFTQQDPQEGKPATQRTEVRFAFGEDALYVGARMYDSLGAAGVRTRLARRDQQVEGDHLMLVLDTFHDHAGRTVLWVNPSGVKYDAGQAAPNADPSWDPIWQVATRIDSLGWTAEMRIPLSQLRFPTDTLQSWGVQVWRYVERLNETSMWSFWGKQESGGPSRFGHLEAVRVRRRPRGFELLPYTVARASYVTPTQPGSPFQDDAAYSMRVGADMKALLTSNLTLDATINPDFGQVEVDPAVVNLSAFETFFPEKRPFFVEGSGLFGFGDFWCYTCSNVSSMSLFYSRRIGRRPQGFVTHPTRYLEVPENSDILGAAKVTGRLANGLQVGLLNAVTGAEEARAVGLDDTRSTREVEPLTNYFVGRAKRNFRGGNTTVGAIATSVVRSFGYDSLRLQMPAHAEAVGADWEMWWKNRTYHLLGNFALSQVSGDSLAILRLQRSSARYFQRPDREHGSNGLFSDRFDPSLESLRGYGGYLRMAKDAGGVLRWETQVNYRSPGFEVNDLAFLTRADYVWMHGNVQGSWSKPTRWYRDLGVTVGGQQQYNFDGDLTDRQLHASFFGQLPNYWSGGFYGHFRPEVFDDRLTRGGPVVRRARQAFIAGNLRTDSRKPVVVGFGTDYGWNAEGAESYSASLDLRLKPAPNVSLSLGPSFSHSESSAQYIRAFGDPTAIDFFGQRVVFGELSQNTLSMNTRLSWTFTPTLTLELFAQPFVSSGDYDGFKEFARPRSLRKRVFGVDAGTVAVDPQARCFSPTTGMQTSCIRIDPDGTGPAGTLSFGNPDFNFRSLRGNAVLRWEWRPGSTLFFVWQQTRNDADLLGDFDFGRDAGGIFRVRPDNVFLVKATYWFGR